MQAQSWSWPFNDRYTPSLPRMRAAKKATKQQQPKVFPVEIVNTPEQDKAIKKMMAKRHRESHSVKRSFPKFTKGMTTREYVRQYFMGNVSEMGSGMPTHLDLDRIGFRAAPFNIEAE